jgi:hypothetical protein
MCRRARLSRVDKPIEYDQPAYCEARAQEGRATHSKEGQTSWGHSGARLSDPLGAKRRTTGHRYGPCSTLVEHTRNELFPSDVQPHSRK